VPAAAQQHEHELDLYAAQKALAMDRMKPGRERFLPFSCTEHQAANNSNNSRSSTPGSTAVNQGEGIELKFFFIVLSARSQNFANENFWGVVGIWNMFGIAQDF
jgi:hypothetical protein